MSTTLPRRLLVIDDEPDLRTLYELTLLRDGHNVETAGSVDDARTALSEHSFDAIITDMRLPDGTGLDVLRHLESQGRREKIIVITAYGSADNAVEALRAGAFDYLTKPVDLKQFRSVVNAALASHGAVSPTLRDVAALKRSETARLGRFLPATTTPLPPEAVQDAGLSLDALAITRPSAALARLVGRSEAMNQVRLLVEKVAKSMAPVQLWGESGTGKELVSRAIHDVSPRRAGPFIAVNCGAIPEHLLESEFFGYRKGAFTGAQEDREGVFQAAQGGTLLLDEIGDLPLGMQSKLLRAIQERAVRPVGATTELALDVRIISATHKNLEEEVRAGRFRQDLFYRLNVIRIPLPALRDRLEDLPVICDQILRRIAVETGMPSLPVLNAPAQAALQAHPFPGNVRELENILHRAMALSSGHLIEVDDLGLDTRPPSQERSPSGPTPPRADKRDDPIAAADLPADLAAHLDQVERDILVRALEHHRLNRTVAAASLGLTLRQMRYRMVRLGVQVGQQGIDIGEHADLPDLERGIDLPDTDGPL